MRSMKSRGQGNRDNGVQTKTGLPQGQASESWRRDQAAGAVRQPCCLASNERVLGCSVQGPKCPGRPSGGQECAKAGACGFPQVSMARRPGQPGEDELPRSSPSEHVQASQPQPLRPGERRSPGRSQCGAQAWPPAAQTAQDGHKVYRSGSRDPAVAEKADRQQNAGQTPVSRAVRMAPTPCTLLHAAAKCGGRAGTRRTDLGSGPGASRVRQPAAPPAATACKAGCGLVDAGAVVGREGNEPVGPARREPWGRQGRVLSFILQGLSGCWVFSAACCTAHALAWAMHPARFGAASEATQHLHAGLGGG